MNWIETYTFIVVYNPPPENDEPSLDFNVCVITCTKETVSTPQYISLRDVCFASPIDNAGQNYFMTHAIKSWYVPIESHYRMTTFDIL